MSATLPTLPAASTAPAAGTLSPARMGPGRATPYRRIRAALDAEWIKLRSLRSMLLTLVAALIFSDGISTLVCSNYSSHWRDLSAAKQAVFDPFNINFGFLRVTVLFFGVVGALVVTNEYGNGLIRTTFAATPQRGVVLAAKTVLLGALALVTATVICFTAFLLGQGALSGHLSHVTLGSPGILARVLGSVFYLTAVALCGVFIGVLSRSTALAMTSVFGVFMVLPLSVDQLPHTSLWRHTVPYLPSNLGESLWHEHVDGFVSHGTAWFLMTLWVVGLGTLAVVWLRRRDA